MQEIRIQCLQMAISLCTSPKSEDYLKIAETLYNFVMNRPQPENPSNTKREA